MISPRETSACFITKDPIYPKEILDAIHAVGFGELLFLTNCDSPHRKQSLFEKTRYSYIYYQDDDCIAPIAALFAHAKAGMVTCAMKPGHLTSYSGLRIALLGWGSIFPKAVLGVLDDYRAAYGEDLVYRRETERIMTHLSFDSYPQQRLDLPITDLPSAYAADRLSRQPGHYEYIAIVDERCKKILGGR